MTLDKWNEKMIRESSTYGNIELYKRLEQEEREKRSDRFFSALESIATQEKLNECNKK